MPDDIWVFIAIGFFAQLVDGALGMAFGVLSTSAMMAWGVAPASASAMTHVAGDIHNRRLRRVACLSSQMSTGAWSPRLAPAGILGGALGA